MPDTQYVIQRSYFIDHDQEKIDNKISINGIFNLIIPKYCGCKCHKFKKEVYRERFEEIQNGTH
jgi:hypothetical protein